MGKVISQRGQSLGGIHWWFFFWKINKKYPFLLRQKGVQELFFFCPTIWLSLSLLCLEELTKFFLLSFAPLSTQNPMSIILPLLSLVTTQASPAVRTIGGYIDYFTERVLQFEITQCDNVLLRSSIFTNESSIRFYLKIIEHIWL